MFITIFPKFDILVENIDDNSLGTKNEKVVIKKDPL